jgi:hypothetical protein
MILPELPRNRGTLDELGPGADNGDNLHGTQDLPFFTEISFSGVMLLDKQDGE